jgi:hypothetical protein
MGQAAISCTDRKPPGFCRGAPSNTNILAINLLKLLLPIEDVDIGRDNTKLNTNNKWAIEEPLLLL